MRPRDKLRSHAMSNPSRPSPMARLRVAAALASLLAFAACQGTHLSPPPPAAGTAAPTVSATTPASGAVGVATNSRVSATFSEAMDPATLTTSTFLVVGAGSGAVAYDAASHIATFTPAANLAASTLFTARITTGAKDVAGHALATDHV